MSIPLLDRRDLDFMLYEWLRVTELTARPRYAEHSRETFDAVIDLAEGIARERFQPINRLLDTEEPRLEGDRVITPAALKPAVQAYCEAGLIGATFDAEVGGMQLPSVVFRAAGAYFSSASVSATLAGLTTPNAATLLRHGSAFHREVIVPPMLAGRWLGTMCLSEPQAGSSLGDITTRAVPQPDGRYRLFGNKMWISGGDQDVSENIIHLVLAKIPGPDGRLVPGTRGISLFMVPKFLVGPDGGLGPRNDVSVAGLNHKLGFRGIPNCLLNFGEGRHPVEGAAGALGSIVGEPGQGLACMFHMMNDARILIGLVGAALGAGAYQQALAYARTRTQGRLPQGKDPASPPVRLIEHADVRRMLLAQKAYAEGALGLVLYCARVLDEERSAHDAAEAERCALLLELLTPVCKSWPAQWCQEGNSLAIQVHGGYGYTRDFAVEQHWRDQRLNPIHEGTHGIQALDLLGRKLRLKNGAAWVALRERIAQTTAAARERGGEWAGRAEALDEVGARLAATVERLYGCGDLDLTLANASAFLEAFGHHVVGWIWLDQALAAAAALDHLAAPAQAEGPAADHYQGKLQAARWFFRWELPRCGPWLDALDALDDTSLRMRDAWF